MRRQELKLNHRVWTLGSLHGQQNGTHGHARAASELVARLFVETRAQKGTSHALYDEQHEPGGKHQRASAQREPREETDRFVCET
jgi:hypothetical protein